MNEKKEWKRPQDVVTFRTSDPKEMLGKYLPRHAVKKWTEDFLDAELFEDVAKVNLNGVWADDEVARDLLIGRSGRHQLEYFELALAKAAKIFWDGHTKTTPGCSAIELQPGAR